MAVMQTAGSGPFPEMGVKEICLFSLGQQTKVKLKVVLKDRGDKFVKWFTKSSKKNLYLKVVQTTDNDALSEIMTEKTFVSSQELKQITTKTKTEQILNIGSELADMGLKFNVTQLQKFFVRQEAGGKLYEIPLELEFLVNTTTPEDLCYVLIPKITGKTFSDSNTGLYSSSNQLNSLIKKEVVFDGGALTKDSKVYLMNQGEKGIPVAWTGAVHFMGENSTSPMTGLYHTGQNKYLSVGTVPNTKIKDFRVLKHVSNINFSKPMPASETFKPAIFSKIYLSRTYYDTTTGYFSVNVNNLLKKYISFSKHFNDSGLNLKDFASFKSFKLVRRKVQIIDGETIPVGPKEVVREFKNPDKALTTGAEDNKFSSVGNTFNDKRSNSLVKMFDFHDELDQSEGAKYQYGIEGTVVDLTSIKANALVKQLSKRSKELETYKVNAEKNYNSDSGCYTTSFINANLNNKVVHGSIKDLVTVLTIGNGPLDISSTVRFFVNMTSPVSGDPEGITALIKAINETASRLQNYSSAYVSKKPGTTSGSSTKANNKSPKNVKEISFSHYFKDVINADSTYYGYEFLSSANKLANLTAQPSVSPIRYMPSRDVKRQEFLDRVELETNKYFIPDAASDAGNFSSTLIPLAGGSSVNPDDSIENTKYSFLTPAVIKMAQIKVKQKETPGGEKKNLALIYNSYDDKPAFDNLNVDVTSIDLDEYNQVASKIVKFNQTGKVFSENSDNSKKATDLVMKEFFGNSGVTIKTSDKNAKKTFNIIDVDSTTKKSFSNIKKDLLKKKKSKQSLFMFSIAADSYLDYDNDSMELYNINSPKSAISKKGFAPDSSPEQITKAVRLLPNQVKSLMFNAIESSVVKKNNLGNENNSLNTSKNFGAYAMLYKTMVIIEYLSGYELDENGSPDLKKEVWRALDLAKLSDTTVENTLCRMTRYEIQQFNIKKINLLDLPIYDEYFKIVNENFDQGQTGGIQSMSPQQEETISAIEAAISPTNSDLIGGNVRVMPEDTFTL
tara:strand:- start:434 stop:3469 length:3036 start_codon:yes stop_codon:yes gene_type:complete